MIYPLFTLLYAVCLLGYFYLLQDPQVLQHYTLPPELLESPAPELLLLLFAVSGILEARLLQRRHTCLQQKSEQLNQQIRELLNQKKELNTQAHVYANHADKLKLFISDKLLEYIEYDEKFLHFKSIASSVRHNGVISYDKVNTLLQTQLASLDPENELYQTTEEARYSMRFLWDLLDLATTDNIALHIANQVCESEELLFQAELIDTGSDLPHSPLFDPHTVLLRALSRCFGSDPILAQDGSIHIVDHDRVWVHCQTMEQQLGNPNHIILALENLINNAQFFAGKQGSRRSAKRSRIAIEAGQSDSTVFYRVYNSGQHINAEDADKLFQLGHSTRRTHQHHGKGLGLYFSHEIVKGYDGKLSFRNIHNQSQTLSIRFELKDNSVITDMFDITTTEDGRIQCCKSGSDLPSDALLWELNGELRSLEISHQGEQTTQRFESEDDWVSTLHDRSLPATPRWQMSIEQSTRSITAVHFQPRDIRGVSFEIRLPTMAARLEGNNPLADLDSMQDKMEQQVALLNTRFKTLADPDWESR